MSDSANGFKQLMPILKDSYSDGKKSETHPYAKKLQKIMEKPNSSKKYFAHLKKYLKKAKR